MRILVTGGAGFIGSNFVRHLLKETRDSVITLDALTYAGSKENLRGVIDHPRHDFVEGNIRDQSLVDDLVGQADSIVNFAAESHVDRSIDSSKPFVSTNLQGTQTLLDAARKADIDRFLQISTDEVYGQTLDGDFSEEDSLDPRNPYAATKAGADLLVKSYATTYSLPVLVTRTCNNFGPRQHNEKLIPKFIVRAATGEKLPVYGDGSNVREWIYVRDNCRALRRVLKAGAIGETYNIGTDCELSNLEVAKRIINAVGGSDEQIEFIDDRPGHDQRYSVDWTKIREIGWEPEWSFERGLEATVDYYLPTENAK